MIFTATPEQMKGYWLNEYFPVAMAKSMEQMPEPELVQDSLTAAGFRVTFTEAYEVLPDLQDFFLYSGKHHPEMYLSETVRKGISTFASLAEPVEVISGCARLRADIESGRIDQVMKVLPAPTRRLPVYGLREGFVTTRPGRPLALLRLYPPAAKIAC